MVSNNPGQPLMSAERAQRPNQKITKEEVRQAIIEICDKKGVPIVRSRDIAELEWVDVERQTINNHLDDLRDEGSVSSLQVGTGYVWWVPADEEIGGDVDVSAIAWDRIEPEEIPDEIVRQRPEVDDPTFWEGMMESWGTVAGGGTFILLAGVVLMLLDGVQILDLGYDFEFWGSLAVLGGFVVLVVAIVIFGFARAGQFFEDIGVNERIRKSFGRRRDQLYRKISHWVQERIEE